MTKKKSKSRSGKLTARQLRAEIKRFFKRNPKKQYNPKQIIKKLKIKNSKDAVQDALDKLAQDGQVVALGDYKYKANPRIKTVNQSSKLRSDNKLFEGRVDMIRSGAAYIVVEGQEEDIFVPERYMNTAMHGDRVKIRSWVPRGRRKPEGEVMEIVKRATEHFVGTVNQYARFAVVTTDGKRSVEIMVDPDDLMGAEDGEKVVVKIVEWSTGRFQNPLGKVTAVLGQPGTSDIEMQAILINNGFQISFPEKVMAEAGQLPTTISEQEIALRRDFREVTTFTIDPDDAKDFDDAISIRPLDNGGLEIGVHIADVTHYVRPGTALDNEAFDRSTSVYLVDRVCPMLPEQISNVLCSLRPHEDKLSFSAVFELDEKYVVRRRWFGKTIIHSNRRFTYNEAQEIIEGKDGDFAEELQLLNKIAKKFRERRYKNGAIDFDSEEVRFRLDKDGVPIDVYVKERKDAHMLVEDFMLLANREVASYIQRKEESRKLNIPFVYRIHDEPNPDKVAELALFAKAMGLQLDISNPRAIARSYNRIVKASEKEPGLKMLSPIAIRTMAKAVYSTENIGHYGLGFDNYAHFTSPIRRYADVLVHRILEKNLGRGLYVEKKAELEEKAGHISRQERHAADAERESIKYKQVEYIEKHVGEVFPGIINGIADFGVFVELSDSKVEGMIPFDYMDESYYISTNKLSIEGRRSGKILRMGDPLKVKIMEADIKSRKITMAFMEALPRPVVELEPMEKPLKRSPRTSRRNRNQDQKTGPGKGRNTNRKSRKRK